MQKGFTPQTVEFDEIETDNDMIAYSQEYAHHVVEKYDMDVDMDLVLDWEVSHRAKRRAAAVKHMNIKGATVGIKISWDDVDSERLLSVHDEFNDVRECIIRLTWKAVEAFDEEEWRSTIRHELIHVEEYQKYGDSGHGFLFKQRAKEIDASLSCDKFTEAKYVIECSDCKNKVADRHRKSKVVKSAIAEDGRYSSKCCSAPLSLR